MQPSVSSGQLTLRPLNCLMVPWPRCGSRPAPSSSWPLSDRGAHGCATIPLGKLQKSQYLHMGWILPPWKSKESSCSSLELLDLDAAIAGPCHQKLAFCDLVAARRRSEGGMPLLFSMARFRKSAELIWQFHEIPLSHLDQVKNCREGSFWLRFAEFRFEEEPSEALLMMCL